MSGPAHNYPGSFSEVWDNSSIASGVQILPRRASDDAARFANACLQELVETTDSKGQASDIQCVSAAGSQLGDDVLGK